MNPFSVVTGGAAGQPAPLRIAPGSKESDAIVDLFLARDRERAEAKPVAATPARSVMPAPTRPAMTNSRMSTRPVSAPRPAGKPGRMLRFLDGPVEVEGTDALDLLISDSEVYDQARTVRATPIEVQTAARVVASASEDRPAALAMCLAGLRPVDVRCPYAAGIELAVDDDGALHLIAWRGLEDAGSAIGELMIASKWAWEHMSLLAKVAPLDERIRPAVQHLVTARSEGLRALLTTSLRVHLAIAVEGRWVCASLNEA